MWPIMYDQRENAMAKPKCRVGSITSVFAIMQYVSVTQAVAFGVKL